MQSTFAERIPYAEALSMSGSVHFPKPTTSVVFQLHGHKNNEGSHNHILKKDSGVASSEVS